MFASARMPFRQKWLSDDVVCRIPCWFTIWDATVGSTVGQFNDARDVSFRIVAEFGWMECDFATNRWENR